MSATSCLTKARRVQGITQEMMTLLADPDLPVRFQAAVALRGLIYNPEESAPREGIEELIGAVFPCQPEPRLPRLRRIALDATPDLQPVGVDGGQGSSAGDGQPSRVDGGAKHRADVRAAMGLETDSEGRGAGNCCRSCST